MYSADDGLANDWRVVHLGVRAAGVVETAAVSAAGRTTPGDLGLWSDRQIEPLARMTGC